MAGISFKHVYKIYPENVIAINDLSIDIGEKEFVVIVGPSGCGKTTILKLMAGLEKPTAGEIYLGDRPAAKIPAKDRNAAMVFQSFALFPFLTVYDNIAFALKKSQLGKAEIDRRVRETADMLEIADQLEKKPKALSGGQKQRVALGRAMVREPDYFLLDEPLSGLDTKLRAEMRGVISKLHQKLEKPFVYVTHDQTEAMTMGGRVIVLNKGIVQQADAPKNIYEFPENLFAAGFIGTPPMNFFDCRLSSGSAGTLLCFSEERKFPLSEAALCKVPLKYLDRNVCLGIRPEDVYLRDEAPADCFQLPVYISYIEELGEEKILHCDFNKGSAGELSGGRDLKFKTRTGNVIAGDKVMAYFDCARLQFFDAVTGENIRKQHPQENFIAGYLSGSDLKIGDINLSLPDAVYSQIEIVKGRVDVSFPLEAVLVGTGGFPAQIVGNNIAGEHRIIELDIGAECRIYALVDKSRRLRAKTTVDIDLKKLRIKKDVVAEALPLPEKNTLEARLYKSKRRRILGEAKQETPSPEGGHPVKEEDITGYSPVELLTPADGTELKKFRFELEVCGKKMELPLFFVDKIMSALGKDYVKAELTIEFPPEGILLGEGPFSAVLSRLFDYRNEKFYELDFHGRKLYAAASGYVMEPGRSYCFSILPEELHIREKNSSMLII